MFPLQTEAIIERKENLESTGYIAPGRTRAWWDNFVSATMLQNE